MLRFTLLVTWTLITVVVAAGDNASADIVAELQNCPITPVTVMPHHINDGDDLVIDFGNTPLPAGSVSFLKIYDANSTADVDPTLSIGAIRIRGAAEAGARLKIQIASSDAAIFEDEDHPQAHPPVNRTDVRRPMFPGVVNIVGGVSFISSIGGDDQSLRDASVLSLVCSGDLHGSIDVGRVFRIRAQGPRFSTTAQGTIYSDITTHKAYSGVAYGDASAYLEDAIVWIIARKGILGNITATGAFWDNEPEPAFHQASIGRIAVGAAVPDSDTPLGVQGNISAHDGHILGVYSTGPIGSSNNTVNIRARAGIGEVRIVPEPIALIEANFPSQAKALDIHANIAADWDATPDDQDIKLKGVSNEDAPLSIVQTDGAFYGSISAGNIVPSPHVHQVRDGRGMCVQEPAGTDFHSGILVRGGVYAPITVNWRVDRCDIIGAEFTQPIDIGISFAGILVATGRDTPNASNIATLPPSQGNAVSISIGHHVFDHVPATSEDKQFNYYHGLRGFLGHEGQGAGSLPPSFLGCGTFANPDIYCNNVPIPCYFDPSEAQYAFGYTPDTWLYGPLNLTQVSATTAVGGSADSLIRANEIGILKLLAMRNGVEKYPPRVEAIKIHDLQIGDLREGSIWSGVYEWYRADDFRAYFATTGFPDGSGSSIQTPPCIRECLPGGLRPYVASDDFTVLPGRAEIGCMGISSHVWYKDCPRFVVQHSCYGGLHLPELRATDTLWIGDRLGRLVGSQAIDPQAAYCECVTADQPVCVDGCAGGPGGGFCSFVIQNEHPHPFDCVPGWAPRMDDIGAVISAGDHVAATSPAIHGQIIVNGDNHLHDETMINGVLVRDYQWAGRATTGPTHTRGDPTLCAGNTDLTPIPNVAVKRNDTWGAGAGGTWDTTAPFYASLPSDIGGGSIGQAPFHVHSTGCEPPNGFGVLFADRRLATITTSHFLTSSTPILIRVRFYGPVQCSTATGTPLAWQSSSGSSPAITILAVDENTLDPTSGVDCTRLFGVHGPGELGFTGDKQRTLGLSARTGFVPKPGVYCIKAKTNLRCADVRNFPTVQSDDDTGQYLYYFRVAPDCNWNSINDYMDIFLDPTLDRGGGEICHILHEGQNPCVADFDRNGTIAVQDIFAFLNAWFAGCLHPLPMPSVCSSSADINDSGALEVQDVFDFLSFWFAASGDSCQ